MKPNTETASADSTVALPGNPRPAARNNIYPIRPPKAGRRHDDTPSRQAPESRLAGFAQQMHAMASVFAAIIIVAAYGFCLLSMAGVA